MVSGSGGLDAAEPAVVPLPRQAGLRDPMSPACHGAPAIGHHGLVARDTPKPCADKGSLLVVGDSDGPEQGIDGRTIRQELAQHVELVERHGRLEWVPRELWRDD